MSASGRVRRQEFQVPEFQVEDEAKLQVPSSRVPG
jgi:hypothetical protein